MKKKIMAVLLAFALAAGPMAGPAGIETVRAQEGQEHVTEDGFRYEDQEDGEGVWIIGYDGNATEIVIPGEIDGKQVTGIGLRAFADCSSLTSVVIPEGVASIEGGAFYDCSSLESVTLPEGVTSIGSNVFDGTPWLEGQIEQGGGLAIVNKMVIAAEKNLTGNIEIPEGVTGIGGRAFSGCSGLTSIEIPEGVTRIWNEAFANCSSLASVKLPESVTSIEYGAFSYCRSLASIEIPKGVISIGDGVFAGCSGLTSVVFQEGLTSIGNRAFQDCSGLTSVALPKGLTSIGNTAFEYCKGLTSVSIPEGVACIPSKAFSGCFSLTSVEIAKGMMEVIDIGAFEKCSSLKNIYYGGSEEQWGEIVIETYGNEHLWSATVYYNSTGIGDPGTGNSGVTEDGFRYEDQEDGEGVLITGYGGSATEVVIPSEINGKKVTGIGQVAFFERNNLTSIWMPDSVTSIGDSAFYGCRSLTNIKISSSVTSIGGQAFMYCNSLTSISLPEGLTFINYNLFQYCRIMSIHIPSTVTGISVCAFGSSYVKDVYYAGSQEQWDKINIMDGNGSLQSATVHYNSSGPSGTGAGTGGSGSGSIQKKPQTITATDITKIYGAKAFSLGAKSSGNGALTYASSNPKVAMVDAAGNVKITGCGITDIVITAKGTDAYSEAKKTIRLTVKPKKLVISSVKSNKKKTATVKWKRDKQASGYLIECATDKKFKKNKVKAEVKKNKTVTTTVKKLKGGKKYYVRVCAYAKSGNMKVQGDWSKAKTVKVKK